MIASIGEYIYSQGDNSAYVHLYVQGEATINLAGKSVKLQQITNYPWEGNVKLKLSVEQPMSFSLHLRIPDWCESYQVELNSQDITGRNAVNNGYLVIEREWNNDDIIELTLDMPVRYVIAHPEVHQMAGRVALMRGPIVYCLEGVDHGQTKLDDIIVRSDVSAESLFTPEYKPELLGGVVVLHGNAVTSVEQNWDKALYQTVKLDKPLAVTAIPYYTWDNREPGEMRVWLRTV
jgi:hypothetical protein